MVNHQIPYVKFNVPTMVVHIRPWLSMIEKGQHLLPWVTMVDDSSYGLIMDELNV